MLTKVLSLNFRPAVILLGAAATMNIDFTSASLWRATVVVSSAPAFNFLVFHLSGFWEQVSGDNLAST
jgi:hypothetical protein